MPHKHILSCVVHAISGVIHKFINPKSIIQNTADIIVFRFGWLGVRLESPHRLRPHFATNS